MRTIGDFLAIKGMARLDTELLIAFVVGKNRAFVLSHPEKILSRSQASLLHTLVIRRKQDEPLAFILGEKEFYGRIFSVNRSTLIPRPETELLVEKTLECIKNTLVEKKSAQGRSASGGKKIAIIDIGTGSGAIIVSLAKHLKKRSEDITFLATDISARALKVAEKNALRHKTPPIFFAQGNLLTPLKKKLQSFDQLFLIANLPYLSESLYRTSPKTVRNFEPSTALVSGSDGLLHYRQLFTQIERFKLTQDIHFFLEISPEQARYIPSFLHAPYTIYEDFSHRPRIVFGRLRPRA